MEQSCRLTPPSLKENLPGPGSVPVRAQLTQMTGSNARPIQAGRVCGHPENQALAQQLPNLVLSALSA